MTDYLMNVAARLLPPVVFKAPWYRRAHTRTYGALTDLVRRRRVEGPGDAPPNLVDALAGARDPAGTLLTEDEVVSYAAYGIGASIGYVGRLTSFMLYEIRRDPDLHAQVVAEAQSAFAAGVHDATGVRRLRILRSVYDETLRYHSLAIGMAFDVASEFRFLGHRIDRGAFLVLSPYRRATRQRRFRIRIASIRRAVASPGTSIDEARHASHSAWAIARARRWAWSS